jgi:hypothetical protein
MLKINLSILVFGVSQLASLFALRACNPTVENTYAPDELVKFYVANDWVPLPMPDSKFSPGVIFELVTNPKPTVRYISDIQTCGIPDDVGKPVVGSSPPITFSKKSDYGADAVLQVKGVEAGPEFSKVRSVTLSEEDHGGDALNLLKIKIWLADPANANKIPQACKDFLDAPNHYIAGESYRVSKGKYTLHGDGGVTFKLTGLKTKILNLGANFHGTVTSDGSLEFSAPVYTAVRRVALTNGGLQTLGDPNQPATSGDDSLKKALYPAMAQPH